MSNVRRKLLDQHSCRQTEHLLRDAGMSHQEGLRCVYCSTCVNYVCADDIRDYLTTHAMPCVRRVLFRGGCMSAGNSTQLTLPADPLQKGKVAIDGSISVTDQNQALVASVELQLALE